MKTSSEHHASTNLGHSFFWTLSGKASQLVGAMFASALVNRALLPAGRGVFAEMQTWVGLFAAFFGLSLEAAIYHFANRERYHVSNGARLFLVTAASMITSTVAGAGLALFFFGWPTRVSPTAASHLLALIALLALTMWTSNLVTLGQALARVRLVATVTLFQMFVNIGIVTPAFLLHRIDIAFALLSAVAVQAAGALTMFLGICRQTGWSRTGISIRVAWQFVSAGIKQHVATVSTFAYVKANQLVVFHYCGEKQAGLFAAALTLSFGLFAGFAAFQMALYPRVIHSDDDLEVTIRSLRLAFYAGLIVILPALYLARPLLRLYGGPSFEEASVPFQLLVLGAWIMTLSSFGAPYVIKAGAFGLSGAGAIVLGIISLILNFILVPRLSSTGAATATTLTTLTGFAISLGMLRIISGTSPLGFARPDFRHEVMALRTALQRWRVAGA